MTALKPRTGGQILVDQLVKQKVEHIFCVPGESYLAVLDALHDAAIPVTVCRQEGGAAMMAEAQGKLTGRPGICFVTRGPGATNASAGIHIAKQDSTPMILFVGQIETGMREREAFQEVDYRAAFGPIAKWATEIDDAARVPEIVSRAFHVAMSGRPGPVVIALPENMLTDVAAVADATYVEAVETYPAPAQMADLQRRLSASRNPIAIVGGSRWSADAVAQFARFAERFKLPVVCSFRRQMLFPADHACYAGDLGLGVNPKLLARIKDADLVLMVGGRLSEVPSQSYTLFGIPGPGTELIHVHPDSGELGRVYAPALAINASPTAFAAALDSVSPPEDLPWAAGTAQAHADYLAWSDPRAVTNVGPLQMGAIMQHLAEVLPDDAIMTNGAGNYATWLHRFHRFRRYGTQAAPTSGSMGYGLPAAVGVKKLYPERTVVSFAGDGCFLMHGQEFTTAVQYDLPIIVLVIDNAIYGTIRMHQEREYPGRVSATSMKSPDFAALAVAYGGYGERVETTEQFAPALARAIASGKPAILHMILDPEVITPTTTLTAIREKAQAAAR
ncbi:thiamine pyrophosphate-binding protein [Chelatococcus asaccharovorans]|uniref:Acetolactate synthase-1/2/3 large subunit n=1 Tax=Chelatococcus asaccharovorans TaxID=28210 RepID=A0A2V3UJ52_9HYPH|nr:thiamine pyrophosphate-binding protein [Chelatococcus asaccharovorans]MBS7706553.1 thiamine pyrophosphate-binding protein [Chelatococcus asaccharovorans]PXW64800.1 acetolactate synthase-1/2/3 large subunit [Chelatococcus asaccharovorans]